MTKVAREIGTIRSIFSRILDENGGRGDICYVFFGIRGKVGCNVYHGKIISESWKKREVTRYILNNNLFTSEF